MKSSALGKLVKLNRIVCVCLHLSQNARCAVLAAMCAVFSYVMVFPSQLSRNCAGSLTYNFATLSGTKRCSLHRSAGNSTSSLNGGNGGIGFASSITGALMTLIFVTALVAEYFKCSKRNNAYNS